MGVIVHTRVVGEDVSSTVGSVVAGVAIVIGKGVSDIVISPDS